MLNIRRVTAAALRAVADRLDPLPVPELTQWYPFASTTGNQTSWVFRYASNTEERDG
jgi:hypothetical protein